MNEAEKARKNTKPPNTVQELPPVDVSSKEFQDMLAFIDSRSNTPRIKSEPGPVAPKFHIPIDESVQPVVRSENSAVSWTDQEAKDMLAFLEKHSTPKKPE